MALRDYLSHYTAKKTPTYPANITIYVDPTGTAPDGSTAAKTIESALLALRELRKEHPDKSVTVRVAPGEYHTDGLKITKETGGSKDAPVTFVADGGPVILNGGITLSAEDFDPIPETFRERLHGEARDKVLVANLKKHGISLDDYGPLYPFGGFHCGSKYDDVPLGTNCEVFMNGRRMTLARWPNKGEYAKLDAVADVGDCHEFPPQNYYHDWGERRNHRGGTYIISRSDNERVSSWKSLDGVWAFGYFFWDWADSSTPVTIDTKNRRFFPKIVSHYGARAGAEFYFYNVPDELDEPGEYWLDRKNALLYIYPYGEMTDARIEMSIGAAPAVTLEDVSYVTLDGFTVCNVRDDGIKVTGDHITIRGCRVTNVANYAIVAEGTHVTVEHCEASHMGRGGVCLTGGDRATLTSGHNRVDNCYIHDFAEVFQTYAGGIHLHGVGNVASHNEICFTPHTALFYTGNDNVIEYNYIHDVVQHSRDAGAVYAGYDWAGQGNVVRYNVVENVGSREMPPEGIYWDDGISGQTAYGNALFNVGHQAFEVGGGFSNVVEHNLIVDCGVPLEYDDRNRDGVVNKGWCHECVDTREGGQWKTVNKMPFRSELWASRFPMLAQIREDVENKDAWDDPHLPINPAFSSMSNNAILRREDSKNGIAESVYRFSRVENNVEFPLTENPGFANPGDGDYRLLPGARLREFIPDFPDIPFDQIGRY